MDGRRKSKRKSKSPSKKIITLTESTKSDKKYMVVIPKKTFVYFGSKGYKVVIKKITVHFGANGYEDYTIHRDKKRMKRYENRHRSRENWTKSGIETAGFWSKWILWNKPTLMSSIRDTEKKFNLKIKYV